MKKYRLYLPFFCLMALLALFSCSHHDKTVIPPTPPAPVDSLFSWRLIDSAAPSGIEDIWFLTPSKGFFLGTDGYIYRSSDSGNSWSKIPGPALNAGTFFIQLQFLDAQYGFAGATTQLEFTRDGGNTWEIKQLPTASMYNFFFTTPAQGFCGDGHSSGLYRTTDTGNTWTKVYAPSGAQYGFFPNFINPSTGFVYTGNGYFAASSDSGNTWSPVSQNTVSNQGSTSFNTLQFLDAQTGFYAGSDGLQMTTNGGKNWSAIHSTWSAISIVKFFDANTGYYLSDNFIYKTVDGGANWSISCRLVKTTFIGMHFINPTTGWACTLGGRIFRLN